MAVSKTRNFKVKIKRKIGKRYLEIARVENKK